jgi:prepilin signal peptidase PulO-like enzyme (type II secretory pathway)
MGSDKARAAIAFVKVVVALVAGYGISWIWIDTRGFQDEVYVPFAPYLAGLVVAVMVYLLLTKLSKGSGGD